MRLIRAFLCDESGATAIEYALIGGLISIAVISGASALGNGVGNLFGYVTNEYTNATR
ncbi:Flp family type IVb pilin [Neorhizobium sp. NPDC001467]|uniref:Flp family type IVb pilin n=1 Tax=Neorhizobium sp. NPDC001467 TaxID=3390595 RepID=UPI003CFC9D68